MNTVSSTFSFLYSNYCHSLPLLSIKQTEPKSLSPSLSPSLSLSLSPCLSSKAVQQEGKEGRKQGRSIIFKISRKQEKNATTWSPQQRREPYKTTATTTAFKPATAAPPPVLLIGIIFVSFLQRVLLLPLPPLLLPGPPNFGRLSCHNPGRQTQETPVRSPAGWSPVYGHYRV